MAVILFRFVVHQSHVKLILRRNLLQQVIAPVEERTPLAVPVDGKRVNTEIFCLLNLFTQHAWILGGISDVDVLFVSEPGLVIGNHLRRTVGAADSLIERAAHVRSIRRASARQNKDDRGNNHWDERPALHFPIPCDTACSDNFAFILIK
ncbi:MAG: hypothetical protein DMG85_21715 [Acidobacteria bacterium]|nr:MAG: hypothetical protein DMG85_21715 [Acidobacteriota bacterium]